MEDQRWKHQSKFKSEKTCVGSAASLISFIHTKPKLLIEPKIASREGKRRSV